MKKTEFKYVENSPLIEGKVHKNQGIPSLAVSMYIDELKKRITG